MNNHTRTDNLNKEAIGYLPLMGIGAAVGLGAYGLKKSFEYLSGGKNIGEMISGFNVDKQKLADFEKDFLQLKQLASDCSQINEITRDAIRDYIEAVDLMLPQMKRQIGEAETKLREANAVKKTPTLGDEASATKVTAKEDGKKN